MLRTAGAGLTLPAVVGRGLSEGLGLARVATVVASKTLEGGGVQPQWPARGACASCLVGAVPGKVLSRGNVSRLEPAGMARCVGLRFLVIAASWPLVRVRRCIRSVRRLARFFAGLGNAREASLVMLLDD